MYLSGYKATGAGDTILNPITHFYKTFLGGEIWPCKIGEIKWKKRQTEQDKIFLVSQQFLS